jgi:flagellar basal body-associated protein FliL
MNEIKQAISTQQKKRTIEKITYQERGQAMVETAFVMIILLVLLSVIIDLGRAFFTYLALQNAVAEGAYYATKDPEPDKIKFRVKHESPDSPNIAGSPLLNWENIEDDDIEVSFLCPNSYVFVVVKVEYPFETIGPVAGMLALLLPDAFSDWDGTFTLRAETKQIVLLHNFLPDSCD